MKKIIKITALLTAALMLCGALVSCADMESAQIINDYINELYASMGLVNSLESDSETETGGDQMPDGSEDSESSDAPDGDESDSEKSDTQPEESESTGSEDGTRYDVECGVPTKAPSHTIECGDGSFARKYTNFQEYEYYSVLNSYKIGGYTQYSSRNTDNTISTTFVGGDTYATLFYRKSYKDFVLVTSKKDAKLFPPENSSYTKVCDTTFTQPELDSAGGMCEIIRLADGRFLIFDSGNANEGDNIYEALCELNGSKNNIRIAAWVFTHSHGDHYGGFKGNGNEYKGFSTKYKDAVELEYVLYAPLARAQWDIMAKLKEQGYATWNTIDYYFVGNDYTQSGFEYKISTDFPEAKLVPVHAGQTYKFADVTLEILYSAEHLYVDNTITGSAYINSNNSSLFCRVVSENGGAAIIAGDCETEGGKWVDATYTTELEANIMQMTHHGMGTDTDLSIMKKSGATVFAWASGEDKYNNTDRSNLMIKQYAARFGESILHGYGTITRPLDHVGRPASGPELLKDGLKLTTNGVNVTKNTAAGITYKVTDNTDPYIAFETDIDTSKYNAIVITVSGVSKTEAGNFYFTSGSQKAMDFENGNAKALGAQSSPYTGYTDRRLIVYLGNGEDFTGKVTSIRIDLGMTVGTTIKITSIQAFKI